MRRTKNNLLVIAGICVLSAGAALSLTQPSESSVSGGELASITVGCNYHCVFPACSNYNATCSSIGSGYCMHTWGSSDQDDTQCPSSGGSAPGCARWAEGLCYINVVFKQHDTYGCSPNGEGACQGEYVNQFPNNSYDQCGELS